MGFIMKNIFALFASVLLAASLVQAQDNPIQTVEGADDLQKVKRAKFRETYVNMHADFTQYTKLYLGDAYFDYRDAGRAQNYRTSVYTTSRKGTFGISEADRKKFEEIVDEAFTKELTKGKRFKIVDSLGPGTIIMRGAVVDIVSRVPPEFVGRSEVYLSTVGEATLIMEFLDGQTGEVLARIAERGRIGHHGGQMGMMPTSSVTVMSDIRRWAANAARRLRTELDLSIEG